jgi:hypothetical protein
MFTTFRLTPTGSDFLPLSYGLVRHSQEKGTIFYLTGLDEALEVGSLHVDEGEGRVLFMLHTHTRCSVKLVVLELF